MRIQESSIRLSAEHEASYSREVEFKQETSFRLVLDDIAATSAQAREDERQRVARMLQSLIEAILAAMDGRKCRDDAAEGQTLPAQAEPGRPRREISWHNTATERIEDHERTRVSGSGLIRTADGREIAFKLGLEMCRDFKCERTVEERGSMVLHDPLVINFDGQAAELTGERIDFDLDMDGSAERLPGLGLGSAFLVLDRNGNGRADDGSELFGAASGNAFADLARLDSDGNGWLDEADPAFARLRVWEGGQAADKLADLGAKGVGALWLGSVDSPFARKDEANDLLGVIRATGVYLKEDGRAGTLQEIDLASSRGATA